MSLARGYTTPVGRFPPSSTVIIGLDTTAPRLTWGAVGGTTAGELLQALYTVDEPGAVEASLELADGRLLTAQVSADRVTVALPYDTPAGRGLLRARTRDAYGNEAGHELLIILSGTVVVPEPTSPPVPAPRPAGGLPDRAPDRRRGEPRTVRTRTRVRTRELHRTHATAQTTTAVDPAVNHTAIARATTGTVVTARTFTTARAGSVTAITRVVVSADARITRRDGRALEEALLLDLL